jgi:uncharacterized membrane protein YecN with MAPEG domain
MTLEATVQMRMMSLVALCCDNEGAEVPFAEVNAALMLEGDDAEGWLVRAFGKMLVDGRINQARTCTHCCPLDSCVFLDGQGCCC